MKMKIMIMRIIKNAQYALRKLSEEKNYIADMLII